MSRELFQYHPVFGFHFIPKLKARVSHEGGGYLIRTNEAGFRSEHEFLTAKPPGVCRILLFGDSFTAGDGVSNAARYGDVLETLLPTVEVFNFGVSGTGTDQHYLIYREVARNIEHDLVVIAVLVENIRRIVARYRLIDSSSGETLLLPKPYFTIDGDGAITLHNSPVPRDPVRPDALPENEQQHVDRGGDFYLLRRMIGALGPRAKSFVQSVVGQNPVPGYDSATSPDWLLMKAILTRWISETARPVIVMPVPLYHFVEEVSSPANYRARFAELAAMPGVTVHDPLADFLVVPRSERRRFRFQHDVHPTPAAHRVLAESLARAVSRFLPSTA
ncbi:MAG: SGNH/GDSL hydrolase family protein [Gemmatimonadota bacterium]|nr:SGNH/GDSL hydrolase family protein [Gemmatimonadota bacterium]